LTTSSFFLSRSFFFPSRSLHKDPLLPLPSPLAVGTSKILTFSFFRCFSFWPPAHHIPLPFFPSFLANHHRFHFSFSFPDPFVFSATETSPPAGLAMPCPPSSKFKFLFLFSSPHRNNPPPPHKLSLSLSSLN